MKKEKILITGTETLRYTQSKRRGNRYLRISVGSDGGVLVSAPWHVPERSIERFIRAKLPFIVSALTHFKASGGLSRRESVAEFARCKREADRIIHKRLRELNRYYDFTYARVAIRNPRTIWGSCSREGNLSFSYRAAFLPARLRDYVIVHELCHLRELNHGKRFWALVAKACPDWQACRNELKSFR